jgi:SRSO17 transposase
MVMIMQITKTHYNPELLKKWEAEEISRIKIDEILHKFLSMFNAAFNNSTRAKNFRAYISGLLSNLKRKSIEPIALEIMGSCGVRTLQNFITRSTFDDDKVLGYYQEQLSDTISSPGSEPEGMLSVDGSDFPKKGKNSVGVKRQYCGRLGKVENCQAGVFAAFAGSGGYGIVDRELYLPKDWFNDSHKELRQKCQVPESKEFKTKNEIALDMITGIVDKNLFNAKWIGCDASFGCDHGFVDALAQMKPYYFAATNVKERVFLPGSESPVTVKMLAEDNSFPWVKVGFEGSKGVSYSDIKIIRCFSCRTDNKGIPSAHHEIWCYIRRYQNGDTKYFLTNAPADIPADELHEAATLRWPIEQCFEECKSFLGMADFEGRSYRGFLRHLLFVMIAHFFGTSLRLELKKTVSP